MKESLQQLKTELKQLAVEIRGQKSHHKQTQRDFSKSDSKTWSTTYSAMGKSICSLHSLKFQFRKKHIARCLLRGRTLEQIEGKLKNPKDINNINVREEAAKLVKSIKDKYEQVVCVSETGPKEELSSGTGGTCSGSVSAGTPSPVEKRDAGVSEGNQAGDTQLASGDGGFFERLLSFFRT